MNARQAMILAMDVMGDASSRMGDVDAPLGFGFKAAASVLRAVAKVLRDRDDTIEEIVQRIRNPRSRRLDWDRPVDPLEDTSPQTPSSKKDP